VKLESRTTVDEEHAVAATFANQDEEFDAADALANHDGELDIAINPVAIKTRVNVGLAQEEQRVQVDRQETPHREGCQDKKEHCIQAYH
jgi:hypothetical protein